MNAIADRFETRSPRSLSLAADNSVRLTRSDEMAARVADHCHESAAGK
jgi:hypothetical protein